jgi:hypothetical protein
MINSSKQFIPKNTSMSPIRHSNVKVWGQQSKKPPLGLDRAKSSSQSSKFKSFVTDKDKISKIFAPKLTVIDNNIMVGKKDLDQNLPQQLSKTKVEVEDAHTHYEQQDNNFKSNSKTQTFMNAILPKISFGKYTFGNVKSKLKASKKSIASPKLNNDKPSKPSNEEQFEEVKSIANTSKYDPETIFRKLNNKKHEAKANLFQYIKAASNDAAQNWWDSIKFDYYDKQWFRKLNYQLVAFNVTKNLNRLIVGLCVLGLIGFFTYLSFFDQYFTIKKYTVEYIHGSYLNNQQTYDLINHFQKNKLYKVFPNNQYWFANNLSLTASAKEIFPEIQNVNIKNRQWPSNVQLQVETNKPILTLWVTENNEQKYWRINDNGKISSQDKAAIWYNLVKVEKPYVVQGDPSQQLSLFNHSFENDPSQKQRFKITKKLLDYFKTIDIDIRATTFPSISDTDIIMESSAGTKFLFDSLAFDNDLQIQRLDYFLKFKPDKNDFYELHKKGIYAYFDFRIAHKAHVCKVTEKCNIKAEELPSK